MKIITGLLTALLIVSIAGCKTISVRPDIYCPDPARPVLRIPADDKAALQNYNEVVDYAMQRESQVKCYQNSLK